MKTSAPNKEQTKESKHTKTKSKRASKAKSKAKSKEHEETHSVNEFNCIIHDEFLHYNYTLSSCYQIFRLVDSFDTNTLYANDICNLKVVVQKIVPWHCHTITNLSTALVAYSHTYDVDVIEKICLHSDINSDLTLTPIEMCIVKEYIYNL